MKTAHSILVACSISALAASSALAQMSNEAGENRFEVTITNLTAGQPFSPGVIVTHSPDVHLFEAGAEPSQGVIEIAENGMPETASEMLQGMMDSGITDVVAIDAPIMRMGADAPNEASFSISANEGDVLSIVTMLICTNDGFVGVDSMPLPGEMTEMEATAYDAGSEVNNELTNSIVDPCGAAGPVMFEEDGNINDIADDGNVIAEHAGIQGVGDLTDAHGWSGPVARISIAPGS